MEKVINNQDFINIYQNLETYIKKIANNIKKSYNINDCYEEDIYQDLIIEMIDAYKKYDKTKIGEFKIYFIMYYVKNYIKNLKRNNKYNIYINSYSLNEKFDNDDNEIEKIDLISYENDKNIFNNIDIEIILDKLDKRDRELIRKVIFEGYSLEDIGKELNVSRQRVHQLYKKALMNLKKII